MAINLMNVDASHKLTKQVKLHMSLQTYVCVFLGIITFIVVSILGCKLLSSGITTTVKKMDEDLRLKAKASAKVNNQTKQPLIR